MSNIIPLSLECISAICGRYCNTMDATVIPLFVFLSIRTGKFPKEHIITIPKARDIFQQWWMPHCDSIKRAYSLSVYQYWTRGLAPLTLLTKRNRNCPIWKELMFPWADMFPIQLVLMKPVLSAHWSSAKGGKKNRLICLIEMEDILRRTHAACSLSGEKCLHQAGRSRWLEKKWIVRHQMMRSLSGADPGQADKQT